MSSSSQRAGPELPPHLLAKRKRKAEATPVGPQRPTSPEAQSKSRSSSPESARKKRRIAGPAPPPAPLDERPAANPNGSESSDDDDFGPAPARPSTKKGATTFGGEDIVRTASVATTSQQQDKPSRRDDWMTMPPKQDDLAARMDPTKIRAKGFNTGKGAKGPGQKDGDNAMWTETPEQKRKRLENEVLGITAPSSDRKEDIVDRQKQKDDEDKARQIREHNEKHRSKTLYDQHQGSGQKKEDDDPSKRAFDYQKDMAAGLKIDHAKRKEMMNKSAGFSSRFSSGSYL